MHSKTLQWLSVLLACGTVAATVAATVLLLRATRKQGTQPGTSRGEASLDAAPNQATCTSSQPAAQEQQGSVAQEEDVAALRAACAREQAARVQAEERAKELLQRLQALSSKATPPAMRPTPGTAGPSSGPPPVAMYQFRPIGYLRSCFTTRNGTPRQPLLVPTALSRLTLLPDVPDASLEGLTAWSHVWVIYWFHENTEPRTKAPVGDLHGVKGKVKVPRLNGEKVGLFATRTPHRPVPLGLSVAQIISVDARTITLGGADIVDGSPVLDIKPYVPFCDAVMGATAPPYVQAEAEEEPLAVVGVTVTLTGRQQLANCWRRNRHRTLYPSADDFIAFVEQVLSRDIRSTRQRLHQGPAAQQRNAASLASAAALTSGPAAPTAPAATTGPAAQTAQTSAHQGLATAAVASQPQSGLQGAAVQQAGATGAEAGATGAGAAGATGAGAAGATGAGAAGATGAGAAGAGAEATAVPQEHVAGSNGTQQDGNGAIHSDESGSATSSSSHVALVPTQQHQGHGQVVDGTPGKSQVQGNSSSDPSQALGAAQDAEGTGVFHVVLEGIDVRYDVDQEGGVIVGGASLSTALAMQHAHKHRQ